MNLHHSVNPSLWNLETELRLLGFGGATMTRREVIRLGLLGSAGVLFGPASYTPQTGRASGGRDVFPGVGAVVSLFKGYDAGYKGLLPPYIVLTELQGRFSEAGFLGSRYRPFATGGDPGANRFVVEGIVAQGISEARQ